MFEKVDHTLETILLPFQDIEFIFQDPFIDMTQKEKEIFLVNKILRDTTLKNIDNAKLLIEKYYGDIIELKENNNKKVFDKYQKILTELSESFITIRDGEICYKYWKNGNDNVFLGPYGEFEKIEIFRRLNAKISLDMIYCFFLAKREDGDFFELENFYSSIQLQDKQLEIILDKGVAENHLHGNAAFNFYFIWQNIMNNDKVEKMYEHKFFIGEEKFSKSSELFLRIASILRIILISFIKDNYDEASKKFLNCKLIEYYKKSEMVFLGKIESFLKKYANIKNLNLIDELELDNEYLGEFIDSFKKEYSISYSIKDRDYIFNVFYNLSGLKTYGENIFLYLAFKYIRSNGSEDLYFRKLFLDYCRIKNNFYTTIIQTRDIKGLIGFSDYYNNATGIVESFIKKESNEKSKEYYKLLLRNEFQDRALKIVEIRFSIKKNEDAMAKDFIKIMRAYREIIKEDYLDGEIDFPRIGITYHFIKEEEKGKNDKCWVNAVYNDKAEKLAEKELRYRILQNKYFNQLNTLLKLRSRNGYISNFIVGIDVASIEDNTPVDVFAPVFECARDREKDKLVFKDKNGHTVRFKTLNFTFHAGEDFRHLLTGLRRIDEVIKRCKFHSGDRIGHGIALGIDASKWMKSNSVILIPRGEYLDNLVWVWNKLSKERIGNSKFSIFLEKEIYNISKEIFGNMSGITIAMLYDAYENKFNPINNEKLKIDKKLKIKEEKEIKEDCNMYNINDEDLIFCKVAKNNERIIWNTKKINYSYHCSCYLKKINEPIYVSVNEIVVELMEYMQNILIEVISEKGIIVEINPSSNTKIGEFESILENHSIKLNRLEELDKKNVIININTDDPIVFNTKISAEYSYIYYSLLNNRESKEKILEWIDKIRRYSMDTTFVQNKISKEEYLEYLEKILEEFYDMD
ncbi:MAG: hypothetical protein ACRDAU_12335 [Clostridium sp.]